MSADSNNLTDKQRLFVEHYVACLNATEAAARAGYSGPRTSLAVIGSDNLRKANIRSAIDARLAEKIMPPSEVLARLAEQARADMRDLFTFDDQGKVNGLRLHRDAPLHLIRSITPTRYGDKVEVHDQQSALQLLGKYYGLFVDRQETGQPGAFVPVREVTIELLPDDHLDTTSRE